MPTRTSSWVVFAIGSLLVIGALSWLALLAWGTDSPSIAVGEGQRVLAPTPVPAAQVPATVLPATVAPATVVPATVVQPAPSASPAPAPTTEPTLVAAPAATRTPALGALTNVLVYDTFLGSGSTEFSAVALNEDVNRLMIADDENRLFEYDLDAVGAPATTPRRSLQVQVGAGDIEGIAWMFGTTYVLAHENDGMLTVVEIDEVTRVVNTTHLVRTIDTGIAEVDGNGLEGVAYVDDPNQDIEFVVVDERPPTVHLIDRNGDVAQSVPVESDLADLSDLSDVWAVANGSYMVVSDEGQAVVDVRLDAEGNVEIGDRLDLMSLPGDFVQPEGIVWSADGTRLYVVGEGAGPGQLTFGLWTTS